jgi:hypothetical protein
VPCQCSTVFVVERTLAPPIVVVVGLMLESLTTRTPLDAEAPPVKAAAAIAATAPSKKVSLRGESNFLPLRLRSSVKQAEI